MEKDFWQRTQYYWLMLIIVGGSVLRFTGLGVQSLWNNELTSIGVFDRDSLSSVLNAVMIHRHPPAFYILQYLLLPLGREEWILRLPAAFFGVATVALMFYLGKSLHSVRTGLASSAMVAVLWYPIYYSQELRSYSLLLFSVVAASACLVPIVRNQPTTSRKRLLYYLGFIFSSTLCIYTHYFGLLWVTLVCIWWLLLAMKNKEKRIGCLSSCLCIAVLYAPWIVSMMRQAGIGTDYWIPQRTSSFAWELLRQFFNQAGGLVVFSILLYLFPLISKAYYKVTKKQPFSFNWKPDLSQTGWILGLWITVPYLVALLFSITIAPIMTFRNFIVILPAVYLLFVYRVESLIASRKINTALYAILISFSFYDLTIVKNYYTKPSKDQYREAVSFVIKNDKEYKNSAVIASVFASVEFDHYFRTMGNDRRVDIKASEISDIQRIDDYLKDQPREYYWFLSGFRKPNPELVSHMKKNLELIHEEKFLGVTTMLFAKKGIKNDVPPSSARPN